MKTTDEISILSFIELIGLLICYQLLVSPLIWYLDRQEKEST